MLIFPLSGNIDSVLFSPRNCDGAPFAMQSLMNSVIFTPVRGAAQFPGHRGLSAAGIIPGRAPDAPAVPPGKAAPIAPPGPKGPTGCTFIP